MFFSHLLLPSPHTPYPPLHVTAIRFKTTLWVAREPNLTLTKRSRAENSNYFNYFCLLRKVLLLPSRGDDGFLYWCERNFFRWGLKENFFHQREKKLEFKFFVFIDKSMICHSEASRFFHHKSSSCQSHDAGPKWMIFMLFDYSISDTFSLLWQREALRGWTWFNDSAKVTVMPRGLSICGGVKRKLCQRSNKKKGKPYPWTTSLLSEPS